MIDLTWREIRQVFVEEDTLYSALLYVYRTYIGNEDDDINEIIDGIFKKDEVSHTGHIIGAICGCIFGYLYYYGQTNIFFNNLM